MNKELKLMKAFTEAILNGFPKNQRVVDTSAAQMAKAMKKAYSTPIFDEIVLMAKKKGVPKEKIAEGLRKVAQISGKTIIEQGDEAHKIFTQKGKFTRMARNKLEFVLSKFGLDNNATFEQLRKVPGILKKFAKM